MRRIVLYMIILRELQLPLTKTAPNPHRRTPKNNYFVDPRATEILPLTGALLLVKRMANVTSVFVAITQKENVAQHGITFVLYEKTQK